jgi:hypothetical protein
MIKDNFMSSMYILTLAFGLVIIGSIAIVGYILFRAIALTYFIIRHYQ